MTPGRRTRETTGVMMGYLLLAAVTAFAVRGSMRHWRDGLAAGAGWYALSNWTSAGGDLTAWHAQWLTPLPAAFAIYFTWIWWNGRRDQRRKAAARAGAKSRALRAALVRKLAGRRIRGGVPAPAPA